MDDPPCAEPPLVRLIAVGRLRPGPEADLFVDGVKVGTHGTGPSWMWQDGSMVKAKMVKSSAAEGTIPWLLLEAQGGEGEGVLQGVSLESLQASFTPNGRASDRWQD